MNGQFRFLTLFVPINKGILAVRPSFVCFT